MTGRPIIFRSKFLVAAKSNDARGSGAFFRRPLAASFSRIGGYVPSADKKQTNWQLNKPPARHPNAMFQDRMSPFLCTSFNVQMVFAVLKPMQLEEVFAFCNSTSSIICCRSTSPRHCCQRRVRRGVLQCSHLLTDHSFHVFFLCRQHISYFGSHCFFRYLFYFAFRLTCSCLWQLQLSRRRHIML
jgi:hypothetical protein